MKMIMTVRLSHRIRLYPILSLLKILYYFLLKELIKDTPLCYSYLSIGMSVPYNCVFKFPGWFKSHGYCICLTVTLKFGVIICS